MKSGERPIMPHVLRAQRSIIAPRRASSSWVRGMMNESPRRSPLAGETKVISSRRSCCRSYSEAMARTPFARPGCVVTSLTRSPRSQTSHSWAWRPLMYSAPVRAPILALPVVRAAGRRGAGGPAGRGATTNRVLLQLEILAGRGVGIALDQAGARHLDARAHAPDESLLEDRRDHSLIGDDLLDLVEERFTLLPVELLGLLLKQIVDLRQRAVRVETALGEERLEPGRRVAGRAGRADQQAFQLLLVPRGHERGAFHGPHARADPDALQVAAHGLGERRVGRQRREIAGVEAVRVAGLGHELFGALGIEGRRFDLEREVEL